MIAFCKSCGAGFSEAQLQENDGAITCRYCGAVTQVEISKEDFPAKPKKTFQYDMPQPGNIVMRKEGSDLLITRGWSRIQGISTLVAGLFWTGITLFFLISIGSGGEGMTMRATGLFKSPTFLTLFLGVFVLIGVLMLVAGIYSLVNSTTIRVNTTSITTKHHPLPWQTKAFLASGIQQVFVSQQVSTSSSNNGRRRTTISYSVEFVLNNGTRKSLVSGMRDADQGRFIEQEIEKYLRIDNVGVRGEYGTDNFF